MASVSPVDSPQSGKARLRWITAFFAYLSLATLATGVLATRHSRTWLISDWLINYEGGFVRRGLPGQVAYYLWHFSHISPVFWAASFYLGCFAIFLAASWRLVARSAKGFWIIALVISPATLSFQIEHPQAGFRKEVIFFAMLGALLAVVQVRKVSSGAVVAALTAFMVIGVLSHEALFFYSPYLFAALVFSGRPVKQSVREFSLPFLAGAIAAGFCSTHIGNMDVAIHICSSLGYKFIGPDAHDICGLGAIPYLRYSPEAARLMSQTVIKRDHYLWIFSGFALLALLPAVGESATLFRRGLGKDLRVLWMAAAASFLMCTVLFSYGIDWGRWIYIHTVSISLLLLFLDGNARAEPLARGTAPRRMSTRRTVFAGALLAGYATLWALPNNLDNTSRMGYVGRVMDRVRHIVPQSPADLPDPVPVTRQN